ncbi:MAG: spermidine/putrescine transport system permease protein, partial [Gaiellales bacterium]|nr:spermidine/putrescine transport system permease protein [Gaiellales bacterium]
PSPRRVRIDGRRLLTGWAMLVYTFLYAPIAIVVIFAFNSNRQVTIWHGFTTHWFGDAWNNQIYRSALETSLRIALASAILSTVLGTAAALALARMRRRWRMPFDALVYLTLVVPEIVIAVASLIFFVRFHARVATFPVLGQTTILLGHTVFNASLVTLIVRARFVGMGSALEEASFDLGAGPLSTFRQVTLPRLYPAVLAAAMLSFVFSFDDYVLSAFTAGGTTQTWPMVVFAAVRFGVTPAINAFATLMLVVTLTVLVLTGLVLRRARATSPAEGGLGETLGLG